MSFSAGGWRDGQVEQVLMITKQEAWLPISTAPLNGEWISLGNRKNSVAGYYDPTAKKWRYGAKGKFIDPTHWQPFPKPPTERP